MLNCWRQGVWRTDMPLYFQIFRQSGFGFPEVFQQMASGNTLLRNRGDGTFDDVDVAAERESARLVLGRRLRAISTTTAGWTSTRPNGWVYNDRGTEIELEFLNNVVSEQGEYKTGIFFDPK